MAHVRTTTNINQTENEKQAKGNTYTSIMLDPKFKNRLSNKLSHYEKGHEKKHKKKADLKVVELNYCLCWGYAKDDELPEFIAKTKTTVENLRAFVEQENKSGQNEFRYTLNVRLFPNEVDTAKVEVCNKLAEDLIIDLKHNGLFIDTEEWRKTDHARAAASAAFDEFHKGDAKENIDNMLETDALDFIGRHLTFKKEQSIKHFLTETKDLLALMNPLAINKHAKEQGVMKRENTYVIVLSEHRLSELTYAVLGKNANDIGYDNSVYCALAIVPTRLPEVKVGHTEESKDRALNNSLTKSASEMKSDPININTNVGNSQNHSQSLPTPLHNKSTRSKHGMFVSNQSSHSPSSGHRSQSPSSSSSDGVSPNGSRVSSLTSSPNSTHAGSRSSNSSSADSSPSGSRHRFFDKAFDKLRGEVIAGKTTLRELAEFTIEYDDLYSQKRGRVKEPRQQQESKGAAPHP